jgi:Alginate export
MQGNDLNRKYAAGPWRRRRWMLAFSVFGAAAIGFNPVAAFAQQAGGGAPGYPTDSSKLGQRYNSGTQIRRVAHRTIVPGETKIGNDVPAPHVPTPRQVRYYKNKSPQFGPFYRLLAQDEDFTYLKANPITNDPLDRLKYIPLFGNPDIFLSLNYDERFQFVSEQWGGNDGVAKIRLPNGALSFTSQQHENFMQIRTLGGANLYIGDNLRAYVEITSARQLGADPTGYVMPAVNNTAAALTAAFVEPKVQIGDGHYGVKVGRQSIYFGNGLLVSVSPTPSVNDPVYTGVDAYADYGYFRVDGFAMKEALFSHTAFVEHASNVDFEGIYGSYDTPVHNIGGYKATMTIEPFFLNYHSELSDLLGTSDYNDAAFLNGAPITPAPFSGYTVFNNDTRQNYGARLYGTIQNFDYDGTATYQGGKYGTYNVEAFFAEGDMGYTFSNVTGVPRIGIRGGVASGGASNATHTINTYNSIASNLYYYTEDSSIAPMNVYHLAPRFRFIPLLGQQTLIVDMYDSFFWRYSSSDAVYSGLSQFAVAPNSWAVTGASPVGSFVGQQPAIEVNYSPQKHVSINATIARFFVGPVMKAVGAKDNTYSRVALTLEF